MPADEEIAEYCDGCKHLKYEADTNFWYCDLDKEPEAHPDEPKFLSCESKKEEI